LTLEIEDTTDFRDKLAHLIDGINALNRSGVDPEAKFDQELIDSFLNQFKTQEDSEDDAEEGPVALKDLLPEFTCDRGGIKYPQVLTAGYIIVNNMTGYKPRDFAYSLFESEEAAEHGLHVWFMSHGQGKLSAYTIKKVTYTHG
jgi:hypothetical protein